MTRLRPSRPDLPWIAVAVVALSPLLCRLLRRCVDFAIDALENGLPPP